MEDVLDVYRRPYDARTPVVCMDEQPVQLVKETRVPWSARPGRPRRVDYEYERAGTACVFLFTEALGGWRRTSVRPRRTAVDWAEEVRRLLDEDYPEAERVILVCDNLNTHTVASLYRAFEPAEARRLARRLEIHYTPKHGSWLRRGRMRTERPVASLPPLPERRRANAPPQGDRLATRPQPPTVRGRLALHDRRRPHQTEKSVPTRSNVMNH
jgi:hypothetical protein